MVQYHFHTPGPMRRLLSIMLVVLVSGGCLKDDLDIAELNHNPFDPAYAGPAIFEVDTVTTGYQTINGEVVRWVRVGIDIRTDRFLTTTTYSVRYKRTDADEWSDTFYMPGDPFMLPTVSDVQSGQVYSWEIQLVNGPGHGAQNTVSVTVP